MPISLNVQFAKEVSHLGVPLVPIFGVQELVTSVMLVNFFIKGECQITQVMQLGSLIDGFLTMSQSVQQFIDRVVFDDKPIEGIQPGVKYVVHGSGDVSSQKLGLFARQFELCRDKNQRDESAKTTDTGTDLIDDLQPERDVRLNV